MNLTTTQKLILTIVGLVIVAALVVVFVIMPQFAQLDALEQQRQTAQAQVQQAQAILAQLEQAKSQSAATEAELLKIGTEMPDSPQLPTLIIEMQDMANASGVNVTSFAPAQPNPSAGGQYTEVQLTTQLTAKWADLLDYMRRIDKSTRLLRVTNVTIAPSTTNTTSTAAADIPLTVGLTLKAYVMGTNGVVSSSATTTPAPQQ